MHEREDPFAVAILEAASSSIDVVERGCVRRGDQVECPVPRVEVVEGVETTVGADELGGLDGMSVGGGGAIEGR